MPPLPAGDVQVALALVPRRDGKALGLAEGAVLDARHVVITRQLERRHVEKRSKPRQGARQRVAYVRDVVPAPVAARERRAARREPGDRRIGLGEKKFPPVAIVLRQQVQRLGRHQFPQWSLELRRWPPPL